MSKKKPVRLDPATLGLPLAGVDSHAHLDMNGSFRDDLPQALDRARAAGVARIGNVFLGPQAYLSNRDCFADRPEVFFVLGVHPNDADSHGAATIAEMRAAFAGDRRLRAVGEIGLDLYWDRVPEAVQRESFVAQLHLARELGVPAVIHSRDAFAQTMDVLVAEGFAGSPVLWHCFGGDAAQARAILDKGWHLSVPGPVTYKKNQELRDAVAFAGLERTLIETDCPFLSPEPWRGTRNEPSLLPFTAVAVAEALGLPVESVWRTTGANALAFFGLD